MNIPNMYRPMMAPPMMAPNPPSFPMAPLPNMGMFPSPMMLPAFRRNPFKDAEFSKGLFV